MRRMRRHLRLALTLLLCLSLSVDPASACQWLVGRWFNRCTPQVSYCQPQWRPTPVCEPCDSHAIACHYSSCDTGCVASGCVETSTTTTTSDCGCSTSSAVVHHDAGATVHSSGTPHTPAVMSTTDDSSPTPVPEPTPTWASNEAPKAGFDARSDGLWIRFAEFFLGRPLRSEPARRQRALFRVGQALCEETLEDGLSVLDMEIHDIAIIEGDVAGRRC